MKDLFFANRFKTENKLRSPVSMVSYHWRLTSIYYVSYEILLTLFNCVGTAQEIEICPYSVAVRLWHRLSQARLKQIQLLAHAKTTGPIKELVKK